MDRYNVQNLRESEESNISINRYIIYVILTGLIMYLIGKINLDSIKPEEIESAYVYLNTLIPIFWFKHVFLTITNDVISTDDYWDSDWKPLVGFINALMLIVYFMTLIIAAFSFNNILLFVYVCLLAFLYYRFITCKFQYELEKDKYELYAEEPANFIDVEKNEDSNEPQFCIDCVYHSADSWNPETWYSNHCSSPQMKEDVRKEDLKYGRKYRCSDEYICRDIRIGDTCKYFKRRKKRKKAVWI